MDADIDFATEIIAEALGEFSSHLTSMRATIGKKGDTWTAEVRSGAHSIKGVAGNLSFERLQHASSHIEDWARENDGKGDAAVATRKLDLLEKLIGEVKVWAARNAASCTPTRLPLSPHVPCLVGNRPRDPRETRRMKRAHQDPSPTSSSSALAPHIERGRTTRPISSARPPATPLARRSAPARRGAAARLCDSY